MFCPNCGAQNADGAAFCASCGTNLNASQAQPEVQETVAEQPAYEQPAYQPPVYEAPVQGTVESASVPMPTAAKVMGIISLVCGILSLVLCCSSFVAVAIAIAGLILGIIASNKAKAVGAKNGLATAGVICSAIGLGLSLILTIVTICSAGCTGCASGLDSLDPYSYDYYY